MGVDHSVACALSHHLCAGNHIRIVNDLGIVAFCKNEQEPANLEPILPKPLAEQKFNKGVSL